MDISYKVDQELEELGQIDWHSPEGWMNIPYTTTQKDPSEYYQSQH